MTNCPWTEASETMSQYNPFLLLIHSSRVFSHGDNELIIIWMKEKNCFPWHGKKGTRVSVVSIQEVYIFHRWEILRWETKGDVRLCGESVWETLHRCSLMLLIILPLFTGVVKLSIPSLTCPLLSTYRSGLTVKEPHFICIGSLPGFHTQLWFHGFASPGGGTAVTSPVAEQDSAALDLERLQRWLP